MSLEFKIKHGVSHDTYWIRPEGKGCFQGSPYIKRAVEDRLMNTQRQIVVDLEAVRGMDSTFMGMLAGLAVRMGKSGRRLHLAGVGEKNRDSLEDLGLDSLMDIEPAGAHWRGHQQEIREGLEELELKTGPGLDGHVLESHQTLSGLSTENEEKFRTVLDILEKEAK
ncbi:MAG: STAS domain-containing protein [Verrucomicrobiales bacterium]